MFHEDSVSAETSTERTTSATCSQGRIAFLFRGIPKAGSNNENATIEDFSCPENLGILISQLHIVHIVVHIQALSLKLKMSYSAENSLWVYFRLGFTYSFQRRTSVL